MGYGQTGINGTFTNQAFIIPRKFIKPRKQPLFCPFADKQFATPVFRHQNNTLFFFLLQSAANRYLFQI